MHAKLGRPNAVPPHRIELKLRDVNQFFNTMDPSPFQEKDLDHDAEEFIVGWTREFPMNEPVVLVVHLGECLPGQDPQPLLTQAVHHYFAYRARLNRLEFRHLMRDARQSLMIGLLFLGACLAASQFLLGQSPGTFASVIRESLTIGGWVAMWRPMEIYLYGWWPVRRSGKIFQKLSRVTVEVHKPSSATG